MAIVTLARPGSLNALNPELVDALRETVLLLERHGARCLLLTGEGRGFSSGADLASGGGLPEDVGATLEAHFNPLMEALSELPIPVVTAVNGVAAGAGCSLALAGDIIVAGRSAYFLQAFINIGLVPDAGANWLLPRFVGRARAMEMMMLGERVPAETALEWGMINRVVEDAVLMEEALGLARRLAAMPTKALGLIRRLARDTASHSLTTALAAERVAQREAGETEDFRAGVAAFLAKTKPVFSGN
ncbi:MAG: Enoyl-CoA hydratase [uncultured Sphingomonadaceae bacterium]|uniref:Enoyl-CoA hydratase n=1 Tax=uncultured Sphingomonadaceae bacterium TaxID=169976 RepID=A0A6J4SDR7_9SPHN|nr:MAG: Enoyl-CoA hydratase [uncultured Sphingomonadaceae bacterium]